MKRFSIALSAMIITAVIAQEPAAPAKDETKGAAATPLAETAASNVDDDNYINKGREKSLEAGRS